MTTPSVNLEVLTEEECWTLLGSQPVQIGRIAFAHDGRIIVLPLNYRLYNRAIVFRTEAGSSVDALVDGTTVSFQIDSVDPTWQEGWSVLVEGNLTEVADPADRRALDALPLRSWAPGMRGRTYRIEPTALNGRRIV